MGTHPIFESDFDCLTEMETWSNRETLALCNYAEQATVDQNFEHIQDLIKPFSDPNRPHDFFSPENCQKKMFELLKGGDTIEQLNAVYREKRIMELKISHNSKKRKVEQLENLLCQLEN